MNLGFYYSYIYKGDLGYESSGQFVRYVEELLNYFDNVVIFAPVFYETIPYRGVLFPKDRIQIIELPAFYKFTESIRNYFEIRKIIKNNINKVDVVISTHVAPFCELLQIFGKKTGIPVIYYVGVSPIDSIQNKIKYSKFKKTILRIIADIYFSYMHFMTKECLYLVNGSIHYDQIKKYHRNVEIVRSSVLRKEDYFFREDTCNEEKIQLLTVCYLEERKDVQTLILAMDYLRSNGICCNLTIVGDGPMRSSLENQCVDLGLENHITFAGMINYGLELNKYYNESDIFVFSSLSEGSPRVIIEAMAHCLPVVTTPCGSVMDHVKPGFSGLIVPFQDYKSFAIAIIKFIKDRELRKLCIKNGYNEVSNMTVNMYIKKMADYAIRELPINKNRVN